MKKLFLLLTAVLLSAGMVVQAAQPVGKNSTPKQCQLIQKSAGSSTFYVKILATNNYGGANKYIFLANVTMNSPTSISGTHFFYNENDNNCYWVQQFNSSTGAVYIDCPICGNLTFTRIGTDASTGAPKYRIQLATGMGYNNALQTGFEATWELPVFCKQSDGTTTIELTDELEDTHNYTQHYYWDDMVVEGSLYVASNYAVVRSQVQANRTDFGETCYPALNLDFIVDPNKENKTNGYLSACSHGWYVPYYGTWSNVYTSTSRLNSSSYVGYIVKDASVGTSSRNYVAAASYFAPNTQNIYKFTGGTIYILNGSADNHPYFYCDMVSSGTTILATIGHAPVYTITYKDQGNVAFSGVHGSGYPTTHTFGKATTLVNPTKSGYTFDGWYTNSACTTSAGSSIGATAQQANFTLYAKWTADACTYEVEFDANGGSGTMANQEFTCGEAQPLNPNAFTGPAATITYNYHGATSGNGTPSVTVYKPFGVWEDSVDEELHDDEEEVSYSVANGATVTMTAQWNAFEGVTLPTPVRTGYTFDGWYTEETGGTKKGNGGANFVPAGSITLHAQWTANTHNVSITAPTNGTITVSYNNGSAQSFTSGSRSIAEGTVLTVTTTPAADYHFGVWTNDGAASVTVNGAKTIGATFAQNDYFLNATYGTHGTGVTRDDSGNNLTVKRAGNTVTLTPVAESGYEFLAWTGDDAAKMSGDVFTFPTNGTHNTTYNVQATFQAITYYLTYNGLEGATNNSNPDTYTIETATFALANPGTRDGYTFTGWTIGGTPVTQITAGSTGDKTITANWQVNSHAVAVVSNDVNYGTVSADAISNVKDGMAITVSENTLTLNGTTVTATAQAEDDLFTYAFDGWTDNAGNALPSTVSGELTIRANFTRSTKTSITLNESGTDEYYTAFKSEYWGTEGEKAKTVTATYNRTFTQGRWSTLCLPFNVNRATMMSQKLNGSVYEFKYATGDATVGDNVMLYFKTANTMNAGQCYIVNANSTLAGRSSFVFNNVTINLANDNVASLTSADDYNSLRATPEVLTEGTIRLVGTLRKGTLIGTATGNTYMGLKDNKIWYPNTSVGNVILAYRGLFRSTEALGASRVRIVVEGETVTELEVVNGELKEAAETRKFVQDGILYIERDGVIYNAQGQKVN